MNENELLEALLTPLRNCKNLNPGIRLRDGRKVENCSFEQFQRIYSIDPVSRWLGIDSESMYISHRVSCAKDQLLASLRLGLIRLFRGIIHKRAGYSSLFDSTWRFKILTKTGMTRPIQVDARLCLDKITNPMVRKNVELWLDDFRQSIDGDAPELLGAVFSFELGHQPGEGKGKPYADLDFGAAAWSRGYLPVFAVFTSSFHSAENLRYFNSSWKVMTCRPSQDASTSLFAFSSKVLGFDLAGFLESYSDTITKEFDSVMDALTARSLPPGSQAILLPPKEKKETTPLKGAASANISKGAGPGESHGKKSRQDGPTREI